MSEAVNLLDETLIKAGLSVEAESMLSAIHIFHELPSTNEWLLAQGGCGELCLAEKQTAGRGRRGRSWQSPSQQNIYLSLRWCYSAVPPNYGCLSLVVGLAVARALDKLGISGHGLKWPNDIYYHDRKLGGILLQTAKPLQQVVIGIGLNANMQTEMAEGIDQPWCSLREISGGIVDRNQVVALILNQLLPALAGFVNLDRGQFAAEWLSRDVLAGRPVIVHQSDQRLPGIAQGIDPDGGLLVEMTDGLKRTFTAADVSVRL
ncbi:MAG: biotin--[acetyl-CoA-carboxylase] ligase [Thiolinea sp.]